LLRLAGEGGYGVHHATADGACSWFELAGHVFAAAGLECDLSPRSTAEMPRPAARPAYSVLRSERADAIRLPHWRDGVAAYLAEREPYVESDDPAPLSSYGRSKLAGERATAEANPRHFVVRTSWLFGVGGRNFVETMLGLAAQGRSVRVIDDQVGSPTFCGHLAAGLLRLAGEGGYGVHHATADGACSWFELAGHVFAAAGLECDLSPCSTAEMPRPATRPAYSVLRSERADGIRLPHWRDGVAAYLAEREPAVGGTRR
ncbi:MAG TPA: sugar nucleotide-binding protein, partial [Thermoleophilaceae bacterium]|nr:sugar nucleotide-binding protein [Thermoleophilaceae bacterium]